MFKSSAPPRHATGDETRTRLIQAATEVFLEDGFRAARVQEIAQRAEQRLSAINYHFGSKEGLYLAVLQHHAEVALAQTPLDPMPAEASPQTRLQIAVEAILRRFLDTRMPSRIAQFMLRELSSPTDALEVMIEHFTLPQVQYLQTVLAEVLGPKVPAAVVRRALLSLMGQCIIYATGRPIINRVAPEIFQDEAMIANTATHIATFTWGGLQALRQQWEANDED